MSSRPGRRGSAFAASTVALTLVGTVLLAAPQPSAAQEGPTVLRLDGATVEVTAEPWSLRVLDDRGEVVLAEHTGAGPTAAGTLGFQTTAGGSRRHRVGQVLPDKAPFGEVDTSPGTGWFHATRAASFDVGDGALRATLDTNDPLGRQLEVEITSVGEGSVQLSAEVLGSTQDVEAVGLAVEAREGERFVGFGERNDAVARTGVVEHYVGEGPYQREEYPFLQPAIVPAWGARQRPDATYFPMPWLLSSAGYGVLVGNDQVSNHRIRQDAADAWSVEVLATELELTVHTGPRPADALGRLVRDLGHQPSPRPVFYGPWVQPFTSFTVDLQTQLDQVAQLRRADAPFSAVEVTHRYLPCGQHRGSRDEIRLAVSTFHDQGLEAYGYNNPLVCSKYNESFDRAVATGGFQRRPDGEPYLFTSYVGAATPPVEQVGQLDLGNPAGDAVLFDNLDLTAADGHDGWMEDFGEYTLFDAVSADGTTGDELHNRFARDYHCAAQRYADEQGKAYARFVRSGWTGSAACSPIVWSGDPTVGWGFDGLASQIPSGLSAGLSGISMWGSDIGGFFALGTNTLSDELLIRWLQLGAVSPTMKTRVDGVAVPAKPRPQIFDEQILPHWRRWASLHTQLLPYLEAATEDYERDGLPIMRHHLLSDPTDEVAAGRDDQYLFGPDLLAAPVVVQGATSREVYLPAGGWVELARSWSFDDAGGGVDLSAAPALREGGQVLEVDAPLDELPLFARRGALLPLLPRDVDTAADYGAGSPGLTRAADAEDRRELIAFPAGESTASFGTARETLTSVEGAGAWSLTFDQERERTWSVQAGLGSLQSPIVPCEVTLDGRRLTGWSYDAGTTVLRVEAAVGDGVLRVASCGGPAPRADAAPLSALPATGAGAALAVGGLVLLAAATALRRRV